MTRHYQRANDHGLLIHCDDVCEVLRVATDAPLIPGFRPQFRHLASFSTWEAWHTSEYARQVEDDNVHQNIEWFWHDLEMHRVSPKRVG